MIEIPVSRPGPIPKQILFLDWDGTLSNGRFWSCLEPKVYRDIQARLFRQNSSLVGRWMLGQQTSEEICRWLAGKMCVGNDVLREALVRSCSDMKLEHELTELISRARENYSVILITDNMDCFSRYTVPTQSLAQHFDRLVNSSDVGRLKKDEEGLSFKMICEELGVSISDCLLIDDCEKTCVLFRELGGRADRTSGVDYTKELLTTYGHPSQLIRR